MNCPLAFPRTLGPKKTHKSTDADVLYLRFGREIESFAKNLRQLIDVAENAIEKRPRRAWGNHNDDCRQALLPLLQAVGDFQATLAECQKLLSDRNRFQRDVAGFIDNVQWHTGTQKAVDELRDRVQFHSTKLLVLTKPFELHLLLEIRRELQELRREVAEIRGLLVTVLANGKPPESLDVNFAFPDIPPEIEHRFFEAARRDGQVSTFDSTQMPLVEGFDALVYQFSRSTVEFNPGLDQKIPEYTQYVNLLKSRWIMVKLDNSIHLQIEGPTSLWASYLRELKSDIIREYRRFNTNQLIAPPQESIVRLPDQCFEIWAKAASPLRPPDLAEKRHEEESVLKLELPESIGSYTTALDVFKRSAIEFRFVTSTKHVSNPGDYQKEVIINTDATRVIPAYAIADAGPNAHNILLSSSHVQDRRWQCLGSSADVNALQHVLTGYRVHHNVSGVSWSINGSTKPGEIGRGLLQLWQLQALSSLPENNSGTDAQRNPSTSSPNSNATTRRQSTALSTASTFFSGSSTTTKITSSRGNATAVLVPEPPVMILFTMCEERYAFLHLELDPDIYVNPKGCDCRKHPKNECPVVFLKSKAKYLKIRRFYSQHDSENGLDTWDLACFRMPRHPQFAKVEVVPKVKHLRLEFLNVEGERAEPSAISYHFHSQLMIK